LRTYLATKLVSLIRLIALGEVPPHLMKLKMELEKTYKSLEEKNELLVTQMCRNFGQTQQNLPNFKLPPIVAEKGSQGR